jgi:hypothetical protein
MTEAGIFVQTGEIRIKSCCFQVILITDTALTGKKVRKSDDCFTNCI